MNEHQIQRSERPEESGLVTAISVVGTVFGVIGMLGSFIPCFGMLALYVAIPAALISGVALGVAGLDHRFGQPVYEDQFVGGQKFEIITVKYKKLDFFAGLKYRLKV